jgi:hypothetical protein
MLKASSWVVVPLVWPVKTVDQLVPSFETWRSNMFWRPLPW